MITINKKFVGYYVLGLVLFLMLFTAQFYVRATSVKNNIQVFTERETETVYLKNTGKSAVSLVYKGMEMTLHPGGKLELGGVSKGDVVNVGVSIPLLLGKNVDAVSYFVR